MMVRVVVMVVERVVSGMVWVSVGVIVGGIRMSVER